MAGVGVDSACFDALATAGERMGHAGQRANAARLFEHAVQFYHGDLCVHTDLYAVVERERMRARHLSVLKWLSTHAYTARDYAACLAYAQRVLHHDPCREDAHRMVMRCHVRLGERAQAFHQYQVCANILHLAFNATPEPETVALFEQVRVDPGSV
jgi:DNA-binding SARP family transcriptional activator